MKLLKESLFSDLSDIQLHSLLNKQFIRNKYDANFVVVGKIKFIAKQRLISGISYIDIFVPKRQYTAEKITTIAYRINRQGEYVDKGFVEIHMEYIKKIPVLKLSNMVGRT